MAKVVVLGAGLAGSAFCVPLADRGHEVDLVGTHVDREVVAALAAGGFHPRLRVALPPAVRALPDEALEEALGGEVALVVIAVSTAGVPWAADQLARAAADRRAPPVLMVTKGLAAADGCLCPLSFRRREEDVADDAQEVDVVRRPLGRPGFVD